MNFTEFAKARQAKAGQKYVREDGQNMAMSRNNLVDVLEELADAYNISWWWLKHYLAVYGDSASPDTARSIMGIAMETQRVAEQCLNLSWSCRELKDEDVVRDVPWE